MPTMRLLLLATTVGVVWALFLLSTATCNAQESDRLRRHHDLGNFQRRKRTRGPRGYDDFQAHHQVGLFAGHNDDNNVHVFRDHTYHKRGHLLPLPPTPPPTTTTPSIISLAKVAAYYYAWWGDDFHRGGAYLRGELEPPQEPLLGEYDDRDPSIVAQHLQWSREANIQVWIASWWGPNKREDNTLREVILPHSDLGELQIGLLYETRNRIQEDDDDDETIGTYNLDNILPDIQHIARNYFDHPNYLRIDGRPVLFVYVTRWLAGRNLLDEAVNLMRQAAADEGGHDLFVVGDQVWRNAPPSDPNEAAELLELLDGVTNYDVYGNVRTPDDIYARADGVELNRQRQLAWREACQSSNSNNKKCAFFPSVTPGFNNKGKNTPLSRRLDEGAQDGSLFRAMLKNALALLDDAADRMLVITSFNEWHEDTQIEPVNPNGETTDQPNNITFGLEYEAYGNLYLDILRDITTE